MKKKYALMGVSPVIGNRGVGALTFGSFEVILKAYPEAELYLIEDARTTSAFNVCSGEQVKKVNIVDVRISRNFLSDTNLFFLLCFSFLLWIFPFRFFKKILVSIIPKLKKLDQIDIFFSIAGGDSFSDIYGMRRFFDVSLTQILVLFLRKKLVLLPQTLGPFNNRISRIITKFILSRAKYIFSRDYCSITEMKSLFGNCLFENKLSFSYDVAFTLKPQKPDEIPEPFTMDRNNIPLVGLNVSGLLYAGGYTGKNQFNLIIDYPAFIKSAIDLIVNAFKARLVLVPHVFGEGSESDSIVCRKIYDKIGAYDPNIFLINKEYTPMEIKYLIGRCDFFIGARMHACIAAISQLVPAVCIAYSKKFIGLMETIGIEYLVADPREKKTIQIIELIKNQFGQIANTKSYLEKVIPDVIASAESILVNNRIQ